MAETRKFSFGPAILIGKRTDIAVPTPIRFAAVQEVTVEISMSAKALYGDGLFPEDIGISTGKLSGKLKQAAIQAEGWNQLIGGSALTTGQPVVILNEAGTIPSSSTYVITVANAANYLEDLGVYSVTNSSRMTRVASGPATGQYSVDESTGIYTFASADGGDSVQISYRYALATGSKVLVTNPTAGDVPYFSIQGQRTHRGKVFGVKIFNAVSTKLGFGIKSDDWTLPEADWEASADEDGNVIEFSQAA